MCIIDVMLLLRAFSQPNNTTSRDKRTDTALTYGEVPSVLLH